MAHPLLHLRGNFSRGAVSYGKTTRPFVEAEFCVTETVAAIVAAHRAGTLSPAQTVARSYLRIRNYNDPAVFISLRDEKEAIAEAESLKAKDARDLPLLGVPVAVKDNIDVLGMPTTAACPAFSYVPSHGGSGASPTSTS